MTISWPFLDKQGVLLLRVFPDVAHLPSSPTPGQMCCVDDGTVTALYQALRSGSSVAWFIVAQPIGPQTVVRNNPADGRLLQFSNDGGATWFGEAFKSVYAVNTAPASGAENQITGSAFGPALSVVGVAPYPGLDATSGDAPGIIASQGGTSNAPAIQMVRTSDLDYPNILESYVDGAAHPNVGQHGGIVALPVGVSLPTAGATWLGTIVIVSPASADNAIYVCIQKADSSYAWIQFGPPGPTGPPGASDLAPITLPPVGGAAKTFWMIVPSEGNYIFALLPVNYQVQVVGAQGLWGGSTGNTFPNQNMVVDYTGSGAGQASFVGRDGRFAKGQIIAAFYDDTGLQYAPDGTHPFGNPLTVLTMEQATYLALLENFADDVDHLSNGELIVQVTITPPATDWTVEIASGAGPLSGNFGDTVTYTSSVGGAGFVGPEFLFNRQVKITVVSTTNYVEGPSSGNTMYGWDPTNKFGTDPHGWATIYYPPAAPDPSGLIFDGALTVLFLSYFTGTYTIQLKIEAP